jgi:hypothetical protein
MRISLTYKGAREVKSVGQVCPIIDSFTLFSSLLAMRSIIDLNLYRELPGVGLSLNWSCSIRPISSPVIRSASRELFLDRHSGAHVFIMYLASRGDREGTEHVASFTVYGVHVNATTRHNESTSEAYLKPMSSSYHYDLPTSI